MALDETLRELLDRIRATDSRAVDALAMPGPPPSDVRAQLIDWCGHAPDELVTWFSTINGTKPDTPLGPHRNLVGTFSAVSLGYAIEHSTRRYRPSRPSRQMPWPNAQQVELMVTEDASLYASADTDPVHAPVWFHHVDDDVHPDGEPLADSSGDTDRAGPAFVEELDDAPAPSAYRCSASARSPGAEG